MNTSSHLSPIRVGQTHHLLAALLALLLTCCLIAPALAGAARSSSDGGVGTILVFTGEKAPLVGSTALLAVKCLGPRGSLCNGTVVVTVGPRKTKVPFALGGGSRQSLAVPVGVPSDGSRQRGFAVARTAQSSGGLARDTAVITFR